MEYFKRFLIIFFIFLLVLSLFLKPAVIFIVKSQVKKILPGASVNINGCSFNPFSRLVLTDLRISRQPDYDCKVSRAEVNFTPASILKGLSGKSLEIIESCQFSWDYLEVKGLRIESGYLKASRFKDDGVMEIRGIKFGKLSLKDIQGKVRLKDEYLFLNSLSAKIFGGFLQGNCRISLTQPFGYQADLNFVNLDLNVFVKDFDLKEKVEITGKVSGFLKSQGQQDKIEFMNGNFAAGLEGGVLTIKDLRFLENMARRSGQAMDLVVESFKNYHYNKGVTTITLQDNNIVFFINLEGNTGKRQLDIVPHDFNWIAFIRGF